MDAAEQRHHHARQRLVDVLQREQQELVGTVVIAELDRAGIFSDENVVEIAREEVGKVEARQIGAERQYVGIDFQIRP